MQDFKRLIVWRKAHSLFLAASNTVTAEFRSRPCHQRKGYSVVELVVVLTIVGIMMSIAIPRVALLLDRIAVDSAASDVQASLSLARSLALAGGMPVAVEVDSLSGVVRIRRGDEILQSRSVGQAHQVRLVPTRDSLTYDPRGLGRGAANLSIVIRRGAAAETVFISRLGRVR